MLNNNYSIAQVTQLFQDVDEPVCVARMEANAGLIKDIHGSDQAAAQGSGQVDPLRFPTGK